jgi:hypothetical protein
MISSDTWSLELRPIVDRTIGPWYLAFNPVFARSLPGPGTDRGFELAPAAKAGYDVAPKIALGLEYYGALGPLIFKTILGYRFGGGGQETR